MTVPKLPGIPTHNQVINARLITNPPPVTEKDLTSEEKKVILDYLLDELRREYEDCVPFEMVAEGLHDVLDEAFTEGNMRSELTRRMISFLRDNNDWDENRCTWEVAEDLMINIVTYMAQVALSTKVPQDKVFKGD